MAAATACVTSPQSKTDVDSDTTTVTFTGVIPHEPGLRVRIQMREEDSSWTTLRTTRVLSDDTWATDVRVPDRAWMGDCGTATFRAVATDGTHLLGSDAECLEELGPSPTIGDRIGCTVDEIVLNRGVTHTGDVTINGQPEADAFACVTEIDGNLTVNSGDSPTISLPMLEHVTGNVEITLNHQAFLVDDGMGGVDQEIVTGAFDAPLLTTINGNVSLTNFKSTGTPSSFGFTFHYGMNALTQLDGNLTVALTFFQIHFEGLNALTHIGGDYTLDWFSSADMDESGLLSGLTSVAGNVSLELPPNARIMVEHLETVGGNFTLTRSSSIATIGNRMAAALVSVGGNFSMTDVGKSCTDSLFPDLTSVGGTLSMHGDAPMAELGGALVAGGLDISGSDLARLPFGAGFALTPAASLTISDNAELCQCAVDAFVSDLQGDGWPGVPTTVNNGADATCTPMCPAGCP